MRFAWKVGMSIVLVAVLLFSAGGGLLIQSQFSASLQREKEAAQEENSLLAMALYRQLDAGRLPGAGAEDAGAQRERLLGLLRGATMRVGARELAFGLSDENGRLLYNSPGFSADTALLDAVDETHRGSVLRRRGEESLLYTAAPFVLGEEVLYLTNAREVTGLFTARGEQYRLLLALLAAALGVSAVLAVVLSRVLTKPLKRLSEATRRFAAGDLNERVPVRGADEIAALSADFNAMAVRLDELVETLRDAAKRQEDFVASFAHEMKTPMTSVIGYADLLRSKKLSDADVTRCAGYIFEEGKRLEGLSMKLLDLIVLDREEFAFAKISAPVLFSAVEASARPLFAKAGVAFSVKAEDAVLFGEEDLLRTLFYNLLDNARKAIDGEGTVSFIGEREDGGYCAVVEDTGRGIPPEELSRITEAFYMVDKSRARSKGGVGLGLAICQKIVRLHGGRLEFESEPGRGTRVRVHLPDRTKAEKTEGGDPLCT